MGSEDSKRYNNSNISDLHLNSSFNSSDYCQMNSSQTEESFSKTKSDKYLIHKKDLSEKNNNKIPVTFEWTGGGNSVYLSGSFCNWNQLFLMQKNSEGKYILKLDITKGLIQYKFKVDNEWKINNNFPSIIDNGNLNNYMDITKIEYSNKSEATTDENTNTESSTKYSTSKYIKYNYGNHFPKNKEMLEANIAPENYWKKIKDENKIENENINHLIFNDNNSVSANNVISVVCRYRLKCTKFIYYKNNKK